MTPLTIFWFRNDLRTSDHPGLFQAASEGVVLPLYIFDEEGAASFKMGGASRWWLHHSLHSLNRSLEQKLNVYAGSATEVFKKLLSHHTVQAVYWSHSYEPWHLEQERAVKNLLQQHQVEFRIFNSSLLWEPRAVLKPDGRPYQIFTPFYAQATLQSDSIRAPLPAPSSMKLIKDDKNDHSIDSLPLLPTTPWYKKLESLWNIGEEHAHEQLSSFLKRGVFGYQDKRNTPALNQTSRLSPHLHFGEISAHQIWHSTRKVAVGSLKKDADFFLRELGWREFFYYQLFHFPELGWKNFQQKFDRFPWRHDDALLKAWQKGETGYPIIDAGMRELWQTGTMHNRVRMIVASFLTKNLLIDWRDGAAWFWDSLVDADLANNSGGWQWVAGCGVDAAPYFRIFNPILQGEKFDPEGIYTRRFVPELRRLANKFLFTPWEAPKAVLEEAGIVLGKNYPLPIVDLQESRNKALQAYHHLT